ncbi:MAG TPA: helix-turn-helix transcriptional regulator, partial [Pyrinomonadaceae bacterium]
FLKLFREYKVPDISSDLAAEGIILEMLAHVGRYARPGDKQKMPAWIRGATDAIHAQLESTPRLTQLALEAGVHPIHMARTFRRIHGCSVGEYSRRIRVAKAREMLDITSLPLVEIAATLGFFDQSHFTRVFKRVSGVTPLQYRSGTRVG